MGATVAVADVLIRWADQTSDWVWERTREDTVAALDRMAAAMMSGLGPMGILGPLVGLLTLVAMFLLWIVLLVRGALIPIVVVFAIAFVLPASLLPAMRDATKTTGQMLVALIISKPLITIALTIGLSALGDTDPTPVVTSPPVVTELAPGPDALDGADTAGGVPDRVLIGGRDGTGGELDNAAAGVVGGDRVDTERLVRRVGDDRDGVVHAVPRVEAAAAWRPGRWSPKAWRQARCGRRRRAMQFSYYGSMMRNRLAGGAARQSGAAASSGSASSGGAMAGSAAAGPAAPAVAATAAAGQVAVGAAKSTAQQAAAHASGGRAIGGA